MSSTLKCINPVTGKNKCPIKPGDKRVYCDCSTGRCYSANNQGKPWGQTKREEQKKNDGEVVIYNQEHLVFGYPRDVERHIQMFEKAAARQDTTPLYNPTALQTMSLERLRDLARKHGIEPGTSMNKVLISKILKAQASSQREQDFEEITGAAATAHKMSQIVGGDTGATQAPQEADDFLSATERESKRTYDKVIDDIDKIVNEIPDIEQSMVSAEYKRKVHEILDIDIVKSDGSNTHITRIADNVDDDNNTDEDVEDAAFERDMRKAENEMSRLNIDEFDPYDMLINRVYKISNLRLVEYVPIALEAAKLDIENAFKQLTV